MTLVHTLPVSSASRRLSAGLLFGVMVASGAAGLGYELVWTRMLGVALGTETVAIYAVLSAFFIGIALGAGSCSGMIARSPRPHLWYVFAELVIAAWAVTMAFAVPWINGWMPHLVGTTPAALWHWALAFGVTLVVLLPATAAMGMTLPAMVRLFELHRREDQAKPQATPLLYALNTLGAVLGIAFTTFWLAPQFGYSTTLYVFALVNLFCACLVFRLTQAGRHDQIAPAPVQDLSQSGPVAGMPVPRLLLTLFCTGLLGIGYEMVVVRALSQVFEDTVYTFAVVLCVYLLGTALGAAVYQRQMRRRVIFATNTYLLTTAMACLFGAALLWVALAGYEWLLAWLPFSAGWAILAETIITLAVFGLPTVAMGALFAHLIVQMPARPGMGVALAANTVGAACSSLLFAVLLLPLLGLKWLICLLAAGYLALLKNVRTTSGFWAVAVGFSVFVLLPPLRYVDLPEGGKLIAYRDTSTASIAVVSTATDHRHLKVNNHFAMGGTSSRHADHRQTHLPLLLHPNPDKALVLGVGTGMSLSAAQYHSNVSVTAVELLTGIKPLLTHFGTHPAQNAWAIEPVWVNSDARRFVAADNELYDVIIADLFHPARDGAANLYTAEHFTAIAQRLAQGGLFMQWIPLFQMDLITFKQILRAFLSAYPHVQVHVPHLSLHQPIVGLLGSNHRLEFSSGYLQSRVQEPALQQELVALGLNSDLALFGGFLGDETSLRELAGDGALNTDDHPSVLFSAPRFAYAGDPAHGQRLVQLADNLQPLPARLINAESAREYERMDRYWHARNAYLRAGIGIAPDPDPLQMLREVGEPLLEIVRISEDFSPAYLALVQMAAEIHAREPQVSLALLLKLAQEAPGRPEALILLRQLRG